MPVPSPRPGRCDVWSPALVLLASSWTLRKAKREERLTLGTQVVEEGLAWGTALHILDWGFTKHSAGAGGSEVTETKSSASEWCSLPNSTGLLPDASLLQQEVPADGVSVRGSRQSCRSEDGDTARETGESGQNTCTRLQSAPGH